MTTTNIEQKIKESGFENVVDFLSSRIDGITGMLCKNPIDITIADELAKDIKQSLHFLLDNSNYSELFDSISKINSIFDLSHWPKKRIKDSAFEAMMELCAENFSIRISSLCQAITKTEEINIKIVRSMARAKIIIQPFNFHELSDAIKKLMLIGHYEATKTLCKIITDDNQNGHEPVFSAISVFPSIKSKAGMEFIAKTLIPMIKVRPNTINYTSLSGKHTPFQISRSMIKAGYKNEASFFFSRFNMHMFDPIEYFDFIKNDLGGKIDANDIACFFSGFINRNIKRNNRSASSFMSEMIEKYTSAFKDGLGNKKIYLDESEILSVVRYNESKKAVISNDEYLERKRVICKLIDESITDFFDERKDITVVRLKSSGVPIDYLLNSKACKKAIIEDDLSL